MTNSLIITKGRFQRHVWVAAVGIAISIAIAIAFSS
eukprot:CAMPEP_0172369924 /NCGR_PEP_ID=MMETSP1060-20121228/35228_1 /TAXON_ID=37318 /ORGANISM="Pseudo-nitzschia pungens, Strain cf. cingulata" /LENGTH=35 /DNA_ID= /DNA_START= /DNA_END= /DNA_ORIENTATION=